MRPSVVDERSAFDLQALAFLVGAVLMGVFVILFLLAFLPWLLAGALTDAVEGVMRRIGFSRFIVDSIGDWMVVFLVGLVAVAILVIAVTAIAGVANLLSYQLTSRRDRDRDRGRAVPAESRPSNRPPVGNGEVDRSLRETQWYEERTVDELYAEARHRDIPGRSQMNKAELIRALRGR